VPAGPINDIAGVFRDPQVQHRQMRVEVEHPVAGTLPLIGSPLRLSQTPVAYQAPPPLLGQHTDEVLCGLLGMSGPEVQALRDAGVV
jgi:crotonobetainyl-CoA:carnitine CoA-transferase CaiB-like acyl-CoA transferase